MTNAMPFPALAVSDRHGHEYQATLTHRDGTVLRGVCSASYGGAVHHAYEAWSGRPCVMPFEDHIEPLARATERLGALTNRLVKNEQELVHLLASSGLDAMDRTFQIDVFETVEPMFSGLRAVALEAMNVQEHISNLSSDPHAGAMRDHPLWLLAECTAACALDMARLTADGLGRRGLITINATAVILGFDPTPTEAEKAINCQGEGSWSRAEADTWWAERHARVQHFTRTLKDLSDEAPVREARVAAKLKEALGLVGERLGHDLAPIRRAGVKTPS